MNPDPEATISSLLKTLLQDEEEEVSLASASTEIDERVGDDASRSVAEEKIAIKKELTPQSPCRLLCNRHCGSEASLQVAEGKKRKRQSDEEECATNDKQKKKKKKKQVSCCSFADSKKCVKHEGVHIILMYSNTE